MTRARKALPTDWSGTRWTMHQTSKRLAPRKRRRRSDWSLMSQWTKKICERQSSWISRKTEADSNRVWIWLASERQTQRSNLKLTTYSTRCNWFRTRCLTCDSNTIETRILCDRLDRLILRRIWLWEIMRTRLTRTTRSNRRRRPGNLRPTLPVILSVQSVRSMRTSMPSYYESKRSYAAPWSRASARTFSYNSSSSRSRTCILLL